MKTRDRGPGQHPGRPPTRSGGGLRLSIGVIVAMTFAACDGADSTRPSQPSGPPDGGGDEAGVSCRVSTDDILSLLGPDAIPALTNPPLVAPDDEEASYLTDDDRVVGLLVDGAAFGFAWADFHPETWVWSK